MVKETIVGFVVRAWPCHEVERYAKVEWLYEYLTLECSAVSFHVPVLPELCFPIFLLRAMNLWSFYFDDFFLPASQLPQTTFWFSSGTNVLT